jgi:hypothetical protein
MSVAPFREPQSSHRGAKDEIRSDGSNPTARWGHRTYLALDNSTALTTFHA